MSDLTKLYYFGTNTRQAGHYFWQLGEGQHSFGRSFEDTIKFNPEGLVKGIKDGYMNLVTINGLNIIAIAGSPYDKRPGSKSVFWAEKGTSFKQLKDAILTLPASKNIIDTMPFEIHWPFDNKSS